MSVKKKLVYQVENDARERRANLDTGTRIYTRKGNAIKRLYKGLLVVEYEMVPTGRTYPPPIEF